MKLKFKLFIVIGLIWIPFLILALVSSIKSSLVGIIISAVALTILTISIITYFIIKKMLEHVTTAQTKQIEEITSNKPYQALEEEDILSKDHKKNRVTDLPPTVEELKAEEQKIINDRSILAETIYPFTKNKDSKSPLFDYYDRYMALLGSETSKKPLSKLTSYDTFLSLPNRVLFNELLNKAISHAKRRNKILAILMVDIEAKNNKIGRNLDDVTLTEVGNRMQMVLRAEDIMAKLEGNEFIILLNDIGKPKFASTVARKLLDASGSTVKINNENVQLNVSIGICIFPNDGFSLEDLIQKAYTALYKAKIEGSTYQFYTEELHVEAKEYSRFETDLRQAIKGNDLILYFQPKLNIKTGNIAGVEALLRWVHPEHGILMPAKFLDIAEDTGLIMQIGDWAINEACRINKYWQDEGYEHLTIALNLSPKQFYHPEIVKLVARALQKSKLEPHYLELEISESTVMNEPDKSFEILSSLKALGILISLDHFGVGYTSINHLKRFPVTIIKIDRSFIKGVPNMPDDCAIASAIIALGHTLGMEVIAEGVETAEQVQFLTAQNCDMVQGYFLSYPLPAHIVTQQFKKLMDKTGI